SGENVVTYLRAPPSTILSSELVMNFDYWAIIAISFQMEGDLLARSILERYKLS
ncbi:hypothetical protein WA026_004769, partial [Henosepilachna vigintioctopunctata]